MKAKTSIFRVTDYPVSLNFYQHFISGTNLTFIRAPVTTSCSADSDIVSLVSMEAFAIP